MTDAFIQALADCAEDGEIVLSELRAKCLASIAGGDGQIAFTTRAGLNGKTAEQECKMDASVLLGAVNAAMRIAGGKSVSLTYTDFSACR